jgi:hypothetical protein
MSSYMPRLGREERAPCISEGRNQYPKGGLMVAMAVGGGISSYKAVPSYLPYCIYDTESM